MDNIRYAFNIYYYYTIASVSLNAIYYSYQGIKFIKYGNNLYYKLVSKNNDDEEIEEIEEEFDILENIKIINELEMT
jgi:hypothetical protein|tara:strand:+ start:621 stop:851 length:231 start_codon:yes stop_codon:yes gene_type:complete